MLERGFVDQCLLKQNRYSEDSWLLLCVPNLSKESSTLTCGCFKVIFEQFHYRLNVASISISETQVNGITYFLSFGIKEQPREMLQNVNEVNKERTRIAAGPSVYVTRPIISTCVTYLEYDNTQ